MSLDGAPTLESVLRELEDVLTKTGLESTNAADEPRIRHQLTGLFFGAPSVTTILKTDADTTSDAPAYGGLVKRLVEQLRLTTTYWKGIAKPESENGQSKDKKSSIWIARKWVHGAMVPRRLNRRRLWDPVQIVFDPADGSFTSLNRNLIYEADFTEIPLPWWQFPFDTITVFEDTAYAESPKLGKKKTKGKLPVLDIATILGEAADPAEIGLSSASPRAMYVAKGTRGPYKRGAKSAMVQIVTFPLALLGPVVFLKRGFGRIRSLYVLTSPAGREERMMRACSSSPSLKAGCIAKGEAMWIGGEIKEPDSETLPLLHRLAAEGRKEELAEKLKAPENWFDELDSFGRTPLSWAAANGHDDVVGYLLELGAGPDKPSSRLGRTPLWWAAGSGHASTVELLLQKGAKVDTPDLKDGRTGLWWASKYGHEAVVELLLRNHADKSKEDKAGRSPLEVAKNGKIDALFSRGKTSS